MLMMKLIVCLALLQGDLTPRVLQPYPLKKSRPEIYRKVKGRWLISENCVGLMRVGHEILYTCSSVVLVIQKKSREHLEEKLKEEITPSHLHRIWQKT